MERSGLFFLASRPSINWVLLRCLKRMHSCVCSFCLWCCWPVVTVPFGIPMQHATPHVRHQAPFRVAGVGGVGDGDIKSQVIVNVGLQVNLQIIPWVHLRLRSVVTPDKNPQSPTTVNIRSWIWWYVTDSFLVCALFWVCSSQLKFHIIQNQKGPS